MSKKGQAAMEFLMTYGWAILVVLAAIGALAYFGVLSPDKFLPEKCVLEPGVDCTGFKVTPSGVTLVLRNGLGYDLSVSSVTVGSCSYNTTTNFNNADLATFQLTGCTPGEIGSRFEGDISIDYIDKKSNLSKTMRGTLATKVQT
mgnify:CR=1 FL=1